ncbi:50S ribosomal protein L29 [Armatimonas sp.]|uniref:50S ribosomal protein L29 n=1 Tax=Armatimonas sp. TaxID=1872638 RepID=UPI003750DA94
MANNRQAKQERDELSGLDISGLREQLDTAKKQLWGMRFANGKRQLEKTADLSKTRKRIARINMYLAQKESN